MVYWLGFPKANLKSLPFLFSLDMDHYTKHVYPDMEILTLSEDPPTHPVAC